MGLLAWRAQAAATSWRGGGADLNWSTPANWSGGIPAAASDVFFNTNGVVLDSAANNIVSVSTTIQSLKYTHTNAYTGAQTYHHALIRDGVVLTVSNATAGDAAFVGSGLSLPSSSTRAAISGTNGSLVVLATNGVFNVRQGGSQNSFGIASLDLSGLSNLTVRAQRLLVAGDGTNGDPKRDRVAGELKLARNSLLLLGTAYPLGLAVGQSIGNGGTGGSLELGQTNWVFTDYGMGVGCGKSSACSVRFGAFSNAFARFRNSNGTDRQINWLIGDCSLVKYSGNSNSATVDFSGGTVDALLNVLVVGRSVNDAKGLDAGATDGTLTLAAGVIDTDSAIIGCQMSNYCARAQGTINVDGSGLLIVNHFLQLGRFMGAAPSNGVSFARLNIGARAGGGAASVGGNIFTTTSTLNPTNDSEIIVRNGGSLSVAGNVGPLFNFELNQASLTLDFGPRTNPGAAVCVVSNLLTVAPLALNIAGRKLSAGRITLIKYASRVGNGAGDFTSLSLPPMAEGYLSNNAANSSIDLVITQAAPDTNTPVPPPVRHLVGLIYADYDWEIRESAARADGYAHIDTPRMIQRLRQGNMRTYGFLVKHQVTDWNDFRLEFLPAAQAAGLNVWLYLTPPSEVTPEPFRDDFITWAAEAGKLAQQYSVLTGFAIDDFVGTNLKDTFTPEYFSPDYVARMVAAAHQYSTNLMFLPVVYDYSVHIPPTLPLNYISPGFADNFGPYCGGLIFPYINYTNKDDLTAEAPQIAYDRDVLDGKLAQFLVVYPWSTPSHAGDYAAVSQTLTNNAGFPDAPYLFNARVSDAYSGTTSGYHQLQVLVDGTVVWQRDVAGLPYVEDISLNLQNWVRNKTAVTLTVRMYDGLGVSNFGVTASWNLPAGNWTPSETGAFAGKGAYYPAMPGLHVPMIVMIYDQGYGGWNPTTNYMVQANIIAHTAVQAGQADGIIQYKLDKSDTSPAFPLIQQLYGQWAYTPQFTSITRQPNGNVMLSGAGGGPNIGYTLKAASSPALPSASWVTLATNAFSSSGAFTNADAAAGQPSRFYRLSVP
jgi:hypothetical protein